MFPNEDMPEFPQRGVFGRFGGTILAHTHNSEKDKRASSSHFRLGFPTVLNVNYSHGVRLRKVKEKETQRQKLYVRLISSLSLVLFSSRRRGEWCMWDVFVPTAHAPSSDVALKSSARLRSAQST